MLLYWILLPIVWVLAHILFRFEVIGRENLEAVRDGRAYVIAPNHIANLDPVLIAITIFDWKRLRILAKEELFKNPLAGWFLRCMGAVSIERGKGDTTTVEKLTNECKNGTGIMIFPEGTRTKTGKLGVIKSGAFVIAAAAGADMLPVRIIYGTKDGRLHLFCKVRIVFGEPIPAADLQIRDQSHKMAELRRMKNRLRDELEQLLDLNVVCTISSVDTGLALNALAENRSTVAEAHIQVDTGMGFGGFLVGEPEKILLAYRSLPNVALSGIYTQIHAAPAGQEAEHQLQQFQRVLDAIHAAGFETGTVHAAGSYALMHCDLARMDAVRAGSVLLGRCRRTKDDGLSTVGHGEAGIAEMRWLPKGHTVGAEKTAVLKAPTRVAVVPVGYQHGFGVERPRPAGLLGTLGRWRRGRRLYVRVNGQRARVIGSVGVSETLVDVTDLKCSAGDVVSFDLDPMYARGCVRQYR